MDIHFPSSYQTLLVKLGVRQVFFGECRSFSYAQEESIKF